MALTTSAKVVGCGGRLASEGDVIVTCCALEAFEDSTMCRLSGHSEGKCRTKPVMLVSRGHTPWPVHPSVHGPTILAPMPSPIPFRCLGF